MDAYSLYENNKLVCQPCLAKETGGSSSPISFAGQQKWYKKWWKIDLNEWLTKFQCLPVNAECAREWLKDSKHLNNCRCLEIEVRELVKLFTGSLKTIEEKLKECKCEVSNRPRTPFYDSTYCEKCETTIKRAGKMGIIKNKEWSEILGVKYSRKSFMLKLFRQISRENVY